MLFVGCARDRSTPPIAASSHGSRLEAYLATLHIGMTSEDAERELKRLGCVPIGSVSLAVSHRHSFLFIPDAATVTLQYDEHDRLISWTGAEGQKAPPNTALEPLPHAAFPEPGIYIVQEGDSAALIAKKLGLTFEQLSAINPGIDWSHIKIKQRLHYAPVPD